MKIFGTKCSLIPCLIVQERESELVREVKRQERNEELRKTFAQHTNSFHTWLTDTRTALMDGRGNLEEQLEAVKVSKLSLSRQLHSPLQSTCTCIHTP